MIENRLTEFFSMESSIQGYYRNYCRYLNELMGALDFHDVQAMSECFMTARENDATIFFAGNGGSAATASHFAQDLAEVGRKAGSKIFKTMSLTDNTSFITAVGNDYGYEKIFVIQMAENFKEKDVLVVLSASGNSPNVIEAVEYAKDVGGLSIGLVGFDGGIIAKICDQVIHVKSNPGEYGPVEDIHLILDHMLTSYLMIALSKEHK